MPTLCQTVDIFNASSSICIAREYPLVINHFPDESYMRLDREIGSTYVGKTSGHRDRQDILLQCSRHILRQGQTHDVYTRDTVQSMQQDLCPDPMPFLV